MQEEYMYEFLQIVWKGLRTFFIDKEKNIFL